MSTSALTRSSLSTIPLCFASCSLGSAEDDLPTRLQHLSVAGFDLIELSFPDLQAFASKLAGREVGEKDWDELCAAGGEVKKVCEDLGLEVFILQPFGKYEGWKEGSEEKREAWERVEGWVRIMKSVGVELLQVGSSDAEGPKWDGRREVVVKDLQALCDRLAQEGFRMAYENWCWSSHAPTSQDVYEIVQAVDRDNIGCNFDTFQQAGAIWADPTKEDGLSNAPDRDARWQKSLEQLSQVPASKIAFLQISDAYRPSPPLEDKTIEALRPRGRWSHDYRPFPYVEGGYLGERVEEVTRAVLKTGFRGTLSMEVFDASRKGELLGEYAKEAVQSMQKLLDAVAEEE
ncbi:hypothetical protein JCM8097_002475 [Rhodosporidiobolus ruineniae]